MLFSHAIVRPPGLSFADGLTMSAALGRPDVSRAREQHQDYCRALIECGLQLTTLAADERFPDGTFVEDTAVVAERVAIATRPGAPTRAGEVASIKAALRQFRQQVEQIEPPGTVDGGDVCQADGHFLIGVSQRTNAAGASQLSAVLERHGYRVSLIDIRAHPTLLHLKSGISYLGNDRFLVAPEVARTGALAGYELIEVDRAETYAANCVRVNDVVLVAAGFPKLAARLDGLGLAVRSIEVAEFRKMDGGLSCLSIRF